MGRVKAVLFYGVFWVLGATLSFLLMFMILTVAFMGMVSSGTGDPVLVAGAISSGIMWWLLTLPLVTIVAYPFYFFIRNKVKLPWLVSLILLIALTVLARAILGSLEVFGDIFELARLATVSIFLLAALSLPTTLRQREIGRKKKINSFE